jgi:hypothetical protein
MLPLDESIVEKVENRIPNGRSLVEEYQNLVSQTLYENPLVPKSPESLVIQQKRDERIYQLYNIIQNA